MRLFEMQALSNGVWERCHWGPGAGLCSTRDRADTALAELALHDLDLGERYRVVEIEASEATVIQVQIAEEDAERNDREANIYPEEDQ
jgi:hypothetical protein